MFNKLRETIGRVVNKLFSKNSIKNEIGVDISITDEMLNNIELWDRLYQDTPPWINEYTNTLGLPGTIAKEIARLVTIEFKSEVIGNIYLNDQYQESLKNIKNYIEYACAKGGVVFKPYVNCKHIRVEFVQPNMFYPITYTSSGDITSAIFTEFINKGDKKYTRLEHHDLKEDGYHIYNYAYEKNNSIFNKDSDSLGKRILLNEVEEWSNLEEYIVIKNIDKPLFSYFKIPIANNIDNTSPLGMSVYSRAINLIKEADKQYSRILWEYEATELAIDVDSSLFKVDINTGKSILPKGKERLYRSYNGISDKGLPIEIFSPEIRDESLFNGLNKLLMRIEFNCGLAYGTLSDLNQAVEKTATEIKASKQRSYANISDIQSNLQKSLEHLVYSMDIWAKLYNLPSYKYEMSFNFDDSIVMDKDLELANMLNDVASGILRPEIYLAKKYGVTEEEALKMMPEHQNTSKNPFEEEE